MVVAEVKKLATLQEEIHKTKDIGKYLGDGVNVSNLGLQSGSVTGKEMQYLGQIIPYLSSAGYLAIPCEASCVQEWPAQYAGLNELWTRFGLSCF